jgi:hypothetical protein
MAKKKKKTSGTSGGQKFIIRHGRKLSYKVLSNGRWRFTKNEKA